MSRTAATVTDARGRGWGNPDSVGFRLLNITTGFTHTNKKGQKIAFPGGVHRKVRKLVHALLHDLEQAGFTIPTVGNWGYANRDIRGLPGVKSNHSWGLAIDVDAPHNPMTYGPVHTTLPPNAGMIARKYGFIWGGNYDRRKDPMHFEFMGTPADAKRLTALLKVKPTPVVPAPQPSQPTFTKGTADVDWITLRRGDKGRKVKVLQALLSVNGFPNIEVDGIYGVGTADRVGDFQNKHGIEVTGVAGPKTMKKLLATNIE